MATETNMVLKAKDLAHLNELVSSGKAKARVIRRANMLLMFHRGMSRVDVVKASGAGVATVGRVKRIYLSGGLDAAVYEKARPGRPSVFGEKAQKKILALAKSKPPAGSSRWSLSLLIKHVDLSEKPTRNTVSLILKRAGVVTSGKKKK
jgi:putative transposase